ncbi:type I-E CRISPR-associated protein Cse2/CasB [Amphritea sp. 1_MG-2023]|uniref:type I-E CRISPR-associated protein Cse2/CasB n=1 Tax=Amphritea sp. 1_MG-2023 TaxID=3062670 RepID=UPI0026E44B8C|nr:type I-E CRISPR-associated protein Cse2/CasB [Amphritea sp. 1_MG-2023]MDO6564960.1 type I-E CRISPR-associated protein Cse2/CasB [Amphritea sp. 1_MG-2023]
MDEQSKKVVLRWWQSMNLPADQLKGKGIQLAPTVYKAQLKRCESTDAAMLTEGFRALWLGLGDDMIEKNDVKNIECWASIAAVLAHVKTDSKLKLAQAAGRKGEGDKSVVSELRFSQLQNAKTTDDFLRRIRRIVQQLKGDVSVIQLAEDIHQWFAEFYQLRPRKADKRISVQWAMDYYRAASAKNK